MKKTVCVLLLIFLALARQAAASPAPQSTDIAVVLLGSMEFQRQEYYDLAMDNLTHRFPSGSYHLIIGPYVQRVFDRYSDKTGLIPGVIPNEKSMVNFAWTQSFDRVLFLILTPPVIKSDEITLQWENAQASFQARAIMIDSRRKKILADVSTTQTASGQARADAKHDAFQKCLEELRLRI